MPPRRMKTTQGTIRGTSNPLGDNTPQLNSGTSQQEGIIDPTGNTPTVQEEPNMTQLMQTLIGVVQTQQQLLQQQHAQPRQYFPPTPRHGEHPM